MKINYIAANLLFVVAAVETCFNFPLKGIAWALMGIGLILDLKLNAKTS